MSGATHLWMLVGGVAYYWFVLRRFNSLGFRLLSIFTFIAVMTSVWIQQDRQLQQSVLANGKTVVGKLVDKQQQGTDSTVTVEVRLDDAEPVRRSTAEFISMAEYANFVVGEPIELLHDTQTDAVYVKQSYQRMVADFWILYVFAGFFFVVGVVCWFSLRKLKVGVDEHGDEWIEKEDGTVILDERQRPAARDLKRANILSKLWQMFGR
ncbi:MAG: hypothetical protein NT013_28370 [Planctomycetia bacterium]|nr:hypothetical protein [Planctomycetia bacterium]